MGLERHLIRTPRRVPPRGYVGLCAGQVTYPRKLWTLLAKGRSEGFRVTRPAEVRSETLPIPARLVTAPIDVQRAGVHFSCVFSYSERRLRAGPGRVWPPPLIVVSSSSAWGSSRCRGCDVVLMVVLLGSNLSGATGAGFRLGRQRPRLRSPRYRSAGGCVQWCVRCCRSAGVPPKVENVPRFRIRRAKMRGSTGHGRAG